MILRHLVHVPRDRSPVVADEATQPRLGSPNVERAVQALREANLRLTPQRVAIVRTLADDPSHPTAQHVYNRLLPTMPTMSFATVYNTLGALEQAGVLKVLREGEAARFDPNIEPHDHAICGKCGAVQDVSRRAVQTPNIPSFSVDSVERIYRGVCESCAQTIQSSAK